MVIINVEIVFAAGSMAVRKKSVFLATSSIRMMFRHVNLVLVETLPCYAVFFFFVKATGSQFAVFGYVITPVGIFNI
ncbi:hypothetical protein [Paraburkholderia sp. RL17-337-BIB-A]|uniref:hypothetical protein n=1 Tax=Paraburkholderia sp. RL17-337-BIB-A TaxID=3031636 RepID=UPI0038BAC329